MKTLRSRLALAIWLGLVAILGCGASGEFVNIGEIRDTALVCDTFFIATFDDVGRDVALGASGITIFGHARVTVRSFLRKEPTQVGECRYDRYWPAYASQPSPLPELGRPYLICGSLGKERAESPLSLRWIGDPTPENIRVVQDVIRKKGWELNPDLVVPEPPPPSDPAPDPEQAAVMKPQPAATMPPADTGTGAALPLLLCLMLLVALAGVGTLFLRRTKPNED